MILYHGTALKNWRHIKKRGLRPRGKKPSTWDREMASRTDCVYLSETLPVFYATNATVGKEWLMIVEIDTDTLEDDRRFLPDEDYIWSVAEGKLGSHNNITKNLERYRHVWSESIEHLGSMAYKGVIPASAITRIVKMKYSPLWLMSFDQSTSLIAYKFCSEMYRAKLEWLFKDTDDYPDMFGTHEPGSRLNKKQRADLMKQMSDREERTKMMNKLRDELVEVVTL